MNDHLFRLNNQPCATVAHVSRSHDYRHILSQSTGGAKRHISRAFTRMNASDLALTGCVSASDTRDVSQGSFSRRRAPDVFIRINSKIGANGFPAALEMRAFIYMNAPGLALTRGISASDTRDVSQRSFSRCRAPDVFIRINAAGIALRVSGSRRALLQPWLQPNSATEQTTKPHHSMGFRAFGATENREAAM